MCYQCGCCDVIRAPTLSCFGIGHLELQELDDKSLSNEIEALKLVDKFHICSVKR